MKETIKIHLFFKMWSINMRTDFVNGIVISICKRGRNLRGEKEQVVHIYPFILSAYQWTTSQERKPEEA